MLTPAAVPLDERGVFLLSQLGRHVAERMAASLMPLGLQPAHFGLEAHELVRRTRHPDDRRAYAVRLTGRARAVLREAEASADALEDSVLAPLSEPERRQLIGMLHRVAVHAELLPGVHPGLQLRRARS
ncbi:MarR family winged helix-turn-helix transcriptional regulator [Amycolatopsis saalfeldensis]|uniref:MarR family winged helix-turn-helix transcriptional regulator n=1 Tax=Amycolatopsis saalfeldensis TaxID=394193 RepID=UPI000B86969C|nr:hypothetical protein [Amycolatopsis saalfeldensis]